MTTNEIFDTDKIDRFSQVSARVVNAISHISFHSREIDRIREHARQDLSDYLKFFRDFGRLNKAFLAAHSRVLEVKSKYNELFEGSEISHLTARTYYRKMGTSDRKLVERKYPEISRTVRQAEGERVRAINEVLSNISARRNFLREPISPRNQYFFQEITGVDFDVFVHSQRDLGDALRRDIGNYLRPGHSWASSFFILEASLLKGITENSHLSEENIEDGDYNSLARDLIRIHRDNLARGVIYELEGFVFYCRDRFEVVTPNMQTLLHYFFIREELSKDLPASLRSEHEINMGVAINSLRTNTGTFGNIMRLEAIEMISSSAAEKAYAELKMQLNIVDSGELESRTKTKNEAKARLQEESKQKQKSELEELVRRTSELPQNSSSLSFQSQSIRFCTLSVRRQFVKWINAQSDDWKESTLECLHDLKSGSPVDIDRIKSERKMFELRLVGQALRIYFTLGKSSSIVILAFGNKSTQESDIDIAAKRLNELALG